MSNYEFRLPDVGEGSAEVEISDWFVKVGDSIREDQALVAVASEKAVVEITSPVSGLVVALHGEVGERAAVGSVLVEIRVASDSQSAAGSVAPTPNSANSETPAATPPAPLAAPATRRRAQELGIALESITGTGPDHRITSEDLEQAVAGRSAPAGQVSPPREGVQEIKITGLRRRIAEKMIESKRRIPHFSFVEELDLTELESLRQVLNRARKPDQPKLTLLPFFVHALVQLVPEFPNINGRYDEQAGLLRRYSAVHVGIATQTKDGLMVPVVRHAETLSLWACARELLRVCSAARAGRATREELTGSTITLSSLGVLGGLAATPIINHPEVAIIGPNKLADRPVVLNGVIAIRKMMNLSSSFDHRIIDGYEGALLISRLKELLERPALLFVDRE